MTYEDAYPFITTYDYDTDCTYEDGERLYYVGGRYTTDDSGARGSAVAVVVRAPRKPLGEFPLKLRMLDGASVADAGPPQWSWEQSSGHCYVKLLPDMRLEWGGWEKHPKGGGGATYQSVSEYERTGRPSYSWMSPPSNVTAPLRAAIEAARAGEPSAARGKRGKRK